MRMIKHVIQPQVSIVIPTHNRSDKLKRLLNSIYRNTLSRETYEIIVIDDLSSDGTGQMIKHSFPDVQLIRTDKSVMCGGARNMGALKSRGAYIFFIDDDNILEEQCLEKILQFMQAHKDVGLCAPLMLDYESDGNKIWCAGGVISSLGIISYLYGGHLYEGLDRRSIQLPSVIYSVDYFPNFYCISREIVERGIEIDVRLFPHNWSELDLAIKIKAAGFKFAMITSAITWHDVGHNRLITRVNLSNAYDQPRSRLVFERKYSKGFFRRLSYFCGLLPVSIVYYVFRFFNEPIAFREKRKLLAAYFRGLRDGFATQI